MTIKTLFLISFFFGSLMGFSQSATSYDELNQLFDEGKFDVIISKEASLIDWVKNRNDTIAADVFSFLGMAYLSNNTLDKAIYYLEKEKSILETVLPVRADHYSNTLYYLTGAYLKADSIEQARKIGQQLIEFDKKNHGIESEEYVGSLIKYVDVVCAMGEVEEAEQKLEEVRHEVPEFARGNGVLLSKLADVCSYAGKYTKAERLFFDARTLLHISDGEESEIYLATLSNYATLLLNQGKYDQAEEALSQVLEITSGKEWFTTDAYYGTLNTMALVKHRLGQYKESEEAYRKLIMVDSAAIGVNHRDFAITLSNLGILHIDQGRYSDAEKVLKRALTILKANKETTTISYAKTLNNLAKSYQRARKYSEAVLLLKQSLIIYEKHFSKESTEYAFPLFNLGTVYLYQKSKKALPTLKNVLSIRSKTLGKNHPLYAECEERIAQYYWMKKNKAETGKLYKNVFDNYYGQIDTYFPVLTEEEKSNFFFQKVKPSVETFSSFAVQSNDPQLLGQLFDYQVNTKGLILQATEKVRKSILSSGDSSLISLYEKWETAKDVLTYYYSVHQSQSDIDSLVRVSNDLEKTLARKSASFAKNISNVRITWKSIQGKLKPGEGALECLRYRIFNVDSLQFTNRVGYAFLLITPETKEGPVLIHFANGTEMENRLLKYYRNGIKLKVDDIYTYKNFWESIQDQLNKLKIKKVFFSPDGVYNTINVSSIRNPFTKQYLLDEVDVRRVTSSRTLLEEKKAEKSNGVGYLLGFPDYKVADGTQSASASTSVNSGSRSFRGGMLRLLRNGEGIPPLPGTKTEVEGVSVALKQQFKSVQVKIEANAIESDVKTLSSPSLLHIATHGYFLDEEEGGMLVKMPNPLLMSGLIMAGAENFIQTGHNPIQAHDDGILTAYEAMNLNLDNTDLVVLSACETGLGKVQAGEGVYGLQRAFQVAGAQSIIMSLWSVDDIATQLLMSIFYEQYLKTNDLYSSFRIAQQKLKEKYPQPFYWGAFILVGRGE